MICYSQASAFHPDWAWSTPDGYKDEPTVLNFAFTGLRADGLTRYEGLPVQCFDDGEFLVRSVLIPQLGIRPINYALDAAFENTPGSVRISLSGGQQLSRDLLVSAGVWCASGFEGANAAGSSFVDPVVIPAGGVISLDVLLISNAGRAFESQPYGLSTVLFEADVYGLTGNGRTVTLVDPGAVNAPLSVAVVGVDLTVNLATDGGGAISTTAAQLVLAINEAVAAYGVSFARLLSGDGSELVTAAVLVLANASPSTTVTLAGAFVGFKRMRTC